MERVESKRDKILVIDDEFGPRESLRFLFKNGYDVTCASSVDEGVQQLKAACPDVIIMDIKMPEKTGIEGLREIREIDPHVAVVMLTGFGSLETAQEAIRLGANDYIKKPFDTKEITRTIAGHVEKTKVARMRTRTEEELASLNRKLRAELEQKEQLASLGRASSEFVHDLRNPLSVICGYVEILSNELRQAEQAGESARGNMLEYLSRIERNVQRCQDMSQMWRDLGKRDPGRFEGRRLADILEDLRVDCAPMAAEGNAVLVWDGGPDVRVMADRIQLLRAFQNLISNAFQALADSGGTVRIAWREEDGAVHVLVEDNGCGIPEDMLKAVFEPYYTTKQGAGGMGLGLFIAAKIVEAHNGELVLGNRDEGGAVAHVRLPLVEDAVS